MAKAENWQVLIVEDEFDSIQMISKILRHHGAEVHVANNGYECIQILDTLAPTCIIMDLALPKMDGWETLSKIRADVKIAHLPVIAITAYHSVNVEEDAHDAGFDAYFPKPLETNIIVDHIAKVIQDKS